MRPKRLSSARLQVGSAVRGSPRARPHEALGPQPCSRASGPSVFSDRVGGAYGGVTGPIPNSLFNQSIPVSVTNI